MAAALRRWGFAAALVLAVAPVVLALVGAERDDWRPVGDNAVIAVLSHDVLSDKTPLLGMPSTVTPDNPDESPAHPGPMLFWALAIPERLFSSSPFGLELGALLVNAGAIVLAGVVALRLAGRGAAVGVLVVASLIAWSLGRQLIIDIWNPHIAMYPLLALLVVTWAALGGRVHVLWAVALTASFDAQAHLLYTPLALTMGITAVAGTAYTFVRRARLSEEWKRDALVAYGSAAGVLAVCWMLPVYQQLTKSPGNFVAMQHGVSDSQQQAVGFGYALRLLVQTVGVPPLFLRQATSFGIVNRTWGELGPLRILSALVIIGVLIAGTVLAFRRRDRIATAAGVVAFLALALSTITIARLPEQVLDVTRYRRLEAWVAGAFFWFATAFVLVRALPERVTNAAPLRIVATVGAACILVAIPAATLWTDSYQREDPHALFAVEELGKRTAEKIDKRTPYVMDLVTDVGLYGTTVKYGLLRELLTKGYNVGVYPNDLYLPRTHGAPRDARRLVLLAGQDALDKVPVGGERIASVRTATPEDVANIPKADDAMRAYLRSPSLITGKGRAVLEASDSPEADALRYLTDPSLDPITVIDNKMITTLWVKQLVRSDIFFAPAYRNYAAAHDVVDQLVYDVYAAPPR
jgi:hypothetical protein